MRILNSPAAVCFTKRRDNFREGAYSGNESEDLPVHLSNLKLSRKELGTLNVRDAFKHIRYFLRFTVRKRISGKKKIYFKVNSAKFIWSAQPK